MCLVVGYLDRDPILEQLDKGDVDTSGTHFRGVCKIFGGTDHGPKVSVTVGVVSSVESLRSDPSPLTQS